MILLDQYEMGLIEEYPFGAGSISMCMDSRSCKFLLYYYIHVSTCTVYIYIYYYYYGTFYEILMLVILYI